MKVLHDLLHINAQLLGLSRELLGIAGQLLGLTLALLVLTLLLCAVLALLVKRVLPKQPTLLSLPHSHYVELARWALVRRRRREGGERALEIPMPVGPHFLAFGAIRLLFGGRTSATSFPGSQQEELRASPWRAWARRITASPALITERGELLPDSWAILEHAGLPIDDATRDELDQVVGPAVRQFAYFHIFQCPGLYRRVQASACGPIEMAVFDAIESCFRLSTLRMPRLMELTQPAVDAAVARLRRSFEAVSTVLAGDPYLGSGSGGEAFGGADLAWSALVGWLLLPPGFTGGALAVPAPAELTEGYRALRAELKETRAGRHVAHCYAVYRVYDA